MKPNETCGDCSGLKARVSGVIAILLALCGLHGVTIVQGYTIRAEVAREIARLDREDQAHTFEMKRLDKEVTDLSRVVKTMLAEKQ
jgi:cell division protein FtsB